MKYTQKICMVALIMIGIASFGLAQNAHADARTPHLLRGAHHKVCTDSSDSAARCFVNVMTDSAGKPAVTTLPAGYGPAQFHGAYQLPTASSNPGNIGIVDAYDDPNVTADLSTYDSTYGLPVFPTCTNKITTACFSKVNQNGGTSYPARNTSWSLETSLDVETAHQICQNCRITLVEASSSSYTNLMAAEDRARLLGAKVISNSYGSSEFSSETTYDSHFKYPGIAFVFSSGDSGYGSTYPAASPYVTSVGGTTLNVTAANVWQSESVWDGAASGCSFYELKPAFQKDTGCTKRTITDVSADADPNTGAAVYDSYGYEGYRGWFQVGGTSLATPIIAGAYALADNVGASTYANATPYGAYVYGTNLHDVTTGSNGTCSPAYLCQGTVGYDGPSGLGTPEGTGAF